MRGTATRTTCVGCRMPLAQPTGNLCEDCDREQQQPTAEATARPWGVGDGQIHPKGRALELGDIVVFHPDGWAAMNPNATLHYENPTIAKANAEFIVKAANNFDALREAAGCALADLEGIMPEFEPSGDRTHPAWTTIKELQAALAASE